MHTMKQLLSNQLIIVVKLCICNRYLLRIYYIVTVKLYEITTYFRRIYLLKVYKNNNYHYQGGRKMQQWLLAWGFIQQRTSEDIIRLDLRFSLYTRLLQ